MVIDVEKLEKLSSLKVENKEQMAAQLGSILEYVENLNELDTTQISSSFSTLEGGTPTREDIPTKSDVIDSVLDKAPKADDGFFIVPSIIE